MNTEIPSKSISKPISKPISKSIITSSLIAKSIIPTKNITTSKPNFSNIPNSIHKTSSVHITEPTTITKTQTDLSVNHSPIKSYFKIPQTAISPIQHFQSKIIEPKMQTSSVHTSNSKTISPTQSYKPSIVALKNHFSSFPNRFMR